MSKTRIIKKYTNRRLYDTEQGSYITLENVKDLVFNQIDFKVIDAKSKKDLTQNTLLQIISEQETTGAPLFTNEILRDFIRFYHDKSQASFSKYMEQSMDIFMKQRSFIKNQWDVYQELLNKTIMSMHDKK